MSRLKLKILLAYPKVNLQRPTYLDGERYIVDVRNFLTPKDSYLKEIVKPFSRGKNNDKKMYESWDLLRQTVKYKYDEIEKGKADHWTLPSIVLQRGYDDCDGMAVTLASLAMAAGVPEYRIKIALGKVSKDRFAPSGGHAWVLYLNSDNKWEIWEGTARVQGRKGLASELLGNSWYHTIYNTFNTEFAFDQDGIEDESRYTNT